MVTEDEAGLASFAAAFSKLLDDLFLRIDQAEVRVLLRGGDSVLLTSPEEDVEALTQLVRSATKGTGFTFSGGYGPTMRDAYLALKLAKATGKDKIVTLTHAERR